MFETKEKNPLSFFSLNVKIGEEVPTQFIVKYSNGFDLDFQNKRGEEVIQVPLFGEGEIIISLIYNRGLVVDYARAFEAGEARVI